MIKHSLPSESLCLSLLTEEERILLEALKKTITPLNLKKNPKKRKRILPQSSYCPSQDLSPEISLPQENARPLQKKSIFSVSVASPAPRSLPILEKQTARKIKSRKMVFSGILDLHGLSQKMAFQELSSFIPHHYNQEQRSLLIITGKGQGILQKALLKWLHTEKFLSHIISVEKAARHHGGEGAFYVLLKKKTKK